MREIVGNVTEKRALLILLDEGHGMVGQIICYEAVAPDHFPVVIHLGVEIVPPMPRAKPIKFLKSARIRVIRVLRSVMPFPKSAMSTFRLLVGARSQF